LSQLTNTSDLSVNDEQSLQQLVNKADKEGFKEYYPKRPKYYRKRRDQKLYCQQYRQSQLITDDGSLGKKAEEVTAKKSFADAVVSGEIKTPFPQNQTKPVVVLEKDGNANQRFTQHLKNDAGLFCLLSSPTSYEPTTDSWRHQDDGGVRIILERAQEELAKHDDIQASQKFYLAAILCLDQMAKSYDIKMYSHNAHRALVSFLINEVKEAERELSFFFTSADVLHANHYRKFLRLRAIGTHGAKVVTFTEKVRSLNVDVSGFPNFARDIYGQYVDKKTNKRQTVDCYNGRVNF